MKYDNSHIFDLRERVSSKLSEHFIGHGFTAEQAEAIGVSFCDFALGWRTREGFARSMVDSGIDIDTARSIVSVSEKLIENSRSANHSH